MRAILASLVLAPVFAVAQQAAPEPTLVPGSPVSLEPLQAAKWIQGEALKEFEPGKLYMFECWATWCGPCVAMIPHVNELHKKYHEKGLRVYGINVWEDDAEKVAKFVKDKGEEMSYPVAFTGKGSPFEEKWLKPAGVRGIPRALVVRDGKLVISTHPSRLTDEVIEKLLVADDSAIAEIRDGEAKREQISRIMMGFRQAAAKRDVDQMSVLIEELAKADPASPYKETMVLETHIARGEWEKAGQMLKELPEGQPRLMAVSMLASQTTMRPNPEMPQSFAGELAEAYAVTIEKAPTGARPLDLTNLTRLRWLAGDKDQAVETAARATKAAREPGNRFPVEAFEKFEQSVKDGNPASYAEFVGWLNAGKPAN